MTPTARTLQALKASGYVSDVVEKWIPFAKIRRDLFGFIDIVAMRPGEKGLLGVQATTAGNMSSRVAKAQATPLLKMWLDAGQRFEVWGWAKKGKRGERKTWQVSSVLVGPK